MQALPNWLAEMQVTNLDVSFCKACRIDVVSQMTSLSVLSLQVGGLSSLLLLSGQDSDPTCMREKATRQAL